LIDVAVVAVVAAHVAAFAVLRHEQVRYDGQAKEIAAWMHERGQTRVAWPEELRQAVPTLLDAGVTPVLVGSRDPPQQLAVNETGVVVTTSPNRWRAVTRGRFVAGDLVARLVDLDAAARTPLTGRQVLSQAVSRPYRYAPIRESQELTATRQFTVTVTLSPGKYMLGVEAFDPTRTFSLELTASMPDALLARQVRRLPPVAEDPANPVFVQEPTTLRFEVEGITARRIEIGLTPVGEPGTRAMALMHGWRLARVAS
jgi:hypothetical protein